MKKLSLAVDSADLADLVRQLVMRGEFPMLARLRDQIAAALDTSEDRLLGSISFNLSKLEDSQQRDLVASISEVFGWSARNARDVLDEAFIPFWSKEQRDSLKQKMNELGISFKVRDTKSW